MDTLITSLFICLAIPMLLSLVLVDKKTRLVLVFMLIGVTVCYYISGINGLLLSWCGYRFSYVTTTITPITEEIIKALPVLLFACLYTDDRKQLLTAAAAVGLGFAIMENVYIIADSSDNISIAFAAVRALGAGLMHSLCTAMVGYGISFVRKKKKLFFTGTFALLAAAITYHGVYNMLVRSEYRYMGILLPLATYILLMIVMWRKKNAAKKSSVA